MKEVGCCRKTGGMGRGYGGGEKKRHHVVYQEPLCLGIRVSVGLCSLKACLWLLQP